MSKKNEPTTNEKSENIQEKSNESGDVKAKDGGNAEPSKKTNGTEPRTEPSPKAKPANPAESETKSTNDASPKDEEKKEPIPSFGDVIKGVIAAYGESATEEAEKKCPKIISEFLKGILSKNPSYQKYNILILYDESTLLKGDSDKIYNAVTRFKERKPILLIIYSRGGSADSAYLIGKLCREYAEKEFHVAIPRMAKSAATMICCAANQIHMGSLSELGPIDPQINGLPALGLKNSVEHIAELVKTYPESSEMFAEYLAKSMPLMYLGYYERVAESATHYAEKLLSTHSENLPKSASAISQELVYKYKDHGFVIDKGEAESIFGDKIIQVDTDEYELSNSLYNALNAIKNLMKYFNRTFYYIGSLDTEISFLNLNKEE